MRFLNLPFILITICTVLGILIGNYITLESTFTLFLFFIACCLLTIVWKVTQKPFARTYLFTITTGITFVLFGIALVEIHNPTNFESHYTNYIQDKNIESSTGIRFSIKERLKPTSFYNRYIASIKFIDQHPAQGLVLIKIPKKGHSNAILDIGYTYSSYSRLQPIPKPLNPNQFDYANYLSKQYIYHSITIPPDELSHRNENEWTFYLLASKIRKHINSKLSAYQFNTTQLSIINALFLGQRQDISQETFKQYQDAGAIHILAISGLHIGIILLILNHAFKALERIKRYGKVIKLIVIIVILWTFAIVAGLSPSVLRAVTMFSFFAIGIQNKSEINTYNSLFVSMFVLLCFRPMFLFSVGFQLSYLAVFAIVWIQPIFNRIYQPRWYITKKLWETFTVTIAAQLGLFPLLIFYFHQFPLLFFVSNIIIIPLLGSLLCFGIFTITLALFNILPASIATLFGNCIDFMNTIIGTVASYKTMVVRDIPFSSNMLLISYFIILTSILAFKKRKFKWGYLVAIGMVFMLIAIGYEKHMASRREALIVFHTKNNSVIGVLENQKLTVYNQQKLSKSKRAYLLNNFLVSNHAVLDTSFALKNVYGYKEKILLIIDSTGISPIHKIRPDIVLLTDSPKIHLNRVIDNLSPKLIVADGNNYTSYIDQWEKTCLDKTVSFYRTDKNGAFIINSK